VLGRLAAAIASATVFLVIIGGLRSFLESGGPAHVFSHFVFSHFAMRPYGGRPALTLPLPDALYHKVNGE
jgi:hypothetical protein